MLTVLFLAAGILQYSLGFAYWIGKTTVSNILRKVCGAIYNSLKDTYLRAPTSTSAWLHISRQFEEIWDFPYTIEAIDGEHIRIKCLSPNGQFDLPPLFPPPSFIFSKELI